MAKPAAAPTYTATVTVTPQQIADQICTAIEGGINYWAESFHLVEPDKSTLKERPWYSDPKLYEGPFQIRVTQETEHTRGAGREVILTPEKIQDGLKLMAEKYPTELADMLTENGDASTADVFVQCCVFNDIIYG